MTQNIASLLEDNYVRHFTIATRILLNILFVQSMDYTGAVAGTQMH